MVADCIDPCFGFRRYDRQVVENALITTPTSLPQILLDLGEVSVRTEGVNSCIIPSKTNNRSRLWDALKMESTLDKYSEYVTDGF